MNLRLLLVFMLIMVIAVAGILIGRHREGKHKVFNKRGLSLIKEGKYRAATDYLEVAVTLDPAYSKAHNNLGIAYGKQGKMEAARKCFINAIKHEENFAEAHFNLAKVLEAEQKYDDAVKYYTQAERVAGKYPKARKGLSRLYYKMGREEMRRKGQVRAEELFNKAVELDPDFLEAQYALGRLYMLQGHYSEAVAKFNLVTHLKPGMKMRAAIARAHKYLAEMNESQKRYEEAVVNYRRCLSLEPKNAEARYRLGITLIRLGDLKAAKKEIGRARELDTSLVGEKDLAMELLQKTRSLLEKGELDKAREQLDLAAAVEPTIDTAADRGLLLYKEGQRYERNGNWNRALELYEQAEKNESQLPGLQERLAYALKETNHPIRAIAHFKTLLKHDPKNANWIRSLGEIHIERENYKKAAERFASLGKEAREQYLETIKKWVAHAEKEADWNKAVELYRELLRYEKDNESLRNKMYLALAASGCYDKAIAGMKGILQRNPPPQLPRTKIFRALKLEDASVVHGLNKLGGKHVWHFLEQHNLIMGIFSVTNGKQAFTRGESFIKERLAIMHIKYIGPDPVDNQLTLLLTHDSGKRDKIYLPPLGYYKEVWPDCNGYTFYGYGLGGVRKPARVLFPEKIPLYYDYLYHLGTIYRDAGRSSEARECARQLTRVSLIYQYLGHYKTSELRLRRAADIFPTLFQAHLYLGELLYHMGNLSEALAATKKAATLNPHEPVPANNMGVIYSAMGKKRFAEESFLKAVELDPVYVIPYWNLPIFYKNCGEPMQESFWTLKYKRVDNNMIQGREDGLQFSE